MLDDLKRVALFGSGVAELTRNKAEAVVKELVDRSRENQRELSAFVRSEVTNQIRNLGLATRRDLERLERRVARLESAAPKPAGRPARKTSPAAGAAADKTAAKGSTAGRSAAGGSSAKSSSVKTGAAREPSGRAKGTAAPAPASPGPAGTSRRAPGSSAPGSTS